MFFSVLLSSQKNQLSTRTEVSILTTGLMGNEKAGEQNGLREQPFCFVCVCHTLYYAQKRLCVYFFAEKCMSKRFLLDFYWEVCYTMLILCFITIAVITFLWFYAFNFRL